ncbi:MAG: phosphate ABC transporter permease PstA [Tissierellia bacterium]|nr:phosphate ABC transporter permease PstA [Tissierellia bacterium]
MRMSVPKATGKKRSTDLLLKGLVYFSIIFTIAMLLLVVGHVLIKGLPNLKPELFAWEHTTENQSMMPAIINTLHMILLTLFICVPVGVMTAIYTCEYARPGNKFVKVVRVFTETLQGIPSIIYGLFGMLFFRYFLEYGMSILSGTLTMSIMCLPLIIRASEEALIAVPNLLREAAYGLGARKLRTVFTVVLPSASMGIFSGIILSIGRIVGETAAIIYTAGTMARLARIDESGRTLAIHMYQLQAEGMFVPQAYATAVVLLIVVIIINAISAGIQNKIEAKEQGDV